MTLKVRVREGVEENTQVRKKACSSRDEGAKGRGSCLQGGGGGDRQGLDQQGLEGFHFIETPLVASSRGEGVGVAAKRPIKTLIMVLASAHWKRNWI